MPVIPNIPAFASSNSNNILLSSIRNRLIEGKLILPLSNSIRDENDNSGSIGGVTITNGLKFMVDYSLTSSYSTRIDDTKDAW